MNKSTEAIRTMTPEEEATWVARGGMAEPREISREQYEKDRELRKRREARWIEASHANKRSR